jgi:hypothetical protein
LQFAGADTVVGAVSSFEQAVQTDILDVAVPSSLQPSRTDIVDGVVSPSEQAVQTDIVDVADPSSLQLAKADIVEGIISSFQAGVQTDIMDVAAPSPLQPAKTDTVESAVSSSQAAVQTHTADVAAPSSSQLVKTDTVEGAITSSPQPAKTDVVEGVASSSPQPVRTDALAGTACLFQRLVQTNSMETAAPSALTLSETDAAERVVSSSAQHVQTDRAEVATYSSPRPGAVPSCHRYAKRDIGEGECGVTDSPPRGLLALRSTTEILAKEGKGSRTDKSRADKQLSALLASRYERSQVSVFTSEEISQGGAGNSGDTKSSNQNMKHEQKVEGKPGEKYGAAPKFISGRNGQQQNQLSALLAKRRLQVDGTSCEQHGVVPPIAGSGAGSIDNTKPSTTTGAQRKPSDAATPSPVKGEFSNTQLGALLAKRRKQLEEQTRLSSQSGDLDITKTHRSAVLTMRQQTYEIEEDLDDCKKGGGFYRRRWLQNSDFVSQGYSAQVFNEPQEEPEIDEDMRGR